MTRSDSPSLHALSDARKWLLAGCFALALAGLYSIPLFIGRTPMVKDSAYLQKLFDTTLVVHVDLSILIWFLAVAAMVWRLYRPAAGDDMIRLPYFQPAARYMFVVGILCLAASPWFGGEHIKSDYIPVIGNGVFFAALALLAASMAVAVAEMLLVWNPVRLWASAFSRNATLKDALAFGAWSSAAIALIALLCFGLSARRIDPILTGQSYYEIVFWAGGHVLQFLYAQLLMIAWTVLATTAGVPLLMRGRIFSVLFAFGLVAALLALEPFTRLPVEAADFRLAYTRLMVEGNGIGPALLGLLLVVGMLKGGRRLPWRSAPFIALLASFVLFAAGGVIGESIDGQNVRVPAHYHGSIVGVTLAFMGLAYVLLPRFGLADPARWRLARWQPAVLCFGQLVFAGALAWSGGYEVMRKTVGLEGYPPKVKIAMGLVGGGGAVAVLGGILFVWIVWRAWRPGKAENPA